MKVLILCFLLFYSYSLFSQWQATEARKNYFIVHNRTINTIGGDFNKSYDNGYNWENANLDHSFEFNEYSFICGNDSIVIVPELRNVIHSSNDGGRSYKSIDIDSLNGNVKACAYSKYFSAVAPTENFGVVGGLHLKLLFTFDEGNSWIYNKYDFLDSEREGNEIEFIAERYISILDLYFTESTLYAGGMRSLFKLVEEKTSKDSMFVSIYENLPQQYQKLNILDITGNDNSLYILISDGSHVGTPPTKILNSTDQGETWIEIETSIFELNEIKRLESCGNYLYAIEHNKGLYYTSDKGQSWIEINTYLKDGKIEKFNPIELDRLQFGSEYAFIFHDRNIYRAPLDNCEIVGGVNSIEIKEESISFYPNPTSDVVYLDIKQSTKIELFDIFGKKLVEEFNTRLDISHLSPGTYYLKYLGQVKKIVKI